MIARVRAAARGAGAVARAADGGRPGRPRVGASRLAAANVVRRLALAFAAVALLATQAIGLVHRVEHGGAGGWIAGAGAEHRQQADGADPASDHHCAAVDALALGDAPPAAGPATAVVATVEVRAAPLPAPVRAPMYVAGAQARAPPPSVS